MMMSMALASVVLVGLYLKSLAATPVSQMHPTADQLMRTALEFLAESVGPFASASWPGSGIAIALLAVATFEKLLRDWRVVPAERLRTEGLLSFGGAMLCLALGIGWGRGAGGAQAGFATRYATLAAPILCFAYLVWRNASPRMIALGLCLMMGVLLLYNTVQGTARAERAAPGCTNSRPILTRG